MTNLEDTSEITKLDTKDVLGSTERFISQCRQIHQQIDQITFSDFSTRKISSIVFSGMGGSAYGGHVAVSLFRDDLSIPALVSSDYGLPAHVNSETIIIPTSYSGSTEETITALDRAVELGSEIIVLTSGGKLLEKTKSYNSTNISSVAFDPTNNPSGQPRLGTGYIVLGTIEILRKIGLLKISSKDIENTIDEVESNQEYIKSNAINLAKEIYGYIPIIFSGGMFEGNAHIIRNQFNETAKSFSSFHYIPEANHHVMEGLKNPIDRKLIALFLQSELYDSRVKKRFTLTQDVIEQNNTKVLSYELKGTTKLSQALELLSFGSYLTFYAGILYGQDPSLIPWVDYFKEKLAQ